MTTDQPQQRALRIQRRQQARAEARKKFLAAIGTLTCTCGCAGRVHLSSGTAPCTMCSKCMGFKAKTT